MPPVDITDPERLFRVTLVFDCADPGYKPQITTAFHCYDEGAGPYSEAVVAGIMDVNVTDWWSVVTGTTAVRANFSNGCTLTEIVVERPLMDPLPSGSTAAIGLAGTIAGALPADLAVVASLRTDTRGRSYRGRMYLGGLAGAANNDGVVHATTRADIEASTQALVTACSLDNLPMQVVSLTSDGSPRLVPVRTEVLDVIVDNHFDVQRRRGAA